MAIYCGRKNCEWYDNGKCAQVYGDTPACDVEPVIFYSDEVE